ncbi:MAG: hypothetical protein PHU12_02145 [Candidatus Aenigmarchaeota archaeon]|nr:hypothetical protein [Candidatus Aenigmarchaeota archaeon]
MKKFKPINGSKQKHKDNPFLMRPIEFYASRNGEKALVSTNHIEGNAYSFHFGDGTVVYCDEFTENDQTVRVCSEDPTGIVARRDPDNIDERGIVNPQDIYR